MRTEEEFLDYMMSVETFIVSIYADDPTLTDYSVLRVYEGLIKLYRAEMTQHELKPLDLAPHEQKLLEAVENICEWHLGRMTMQANGGEEEKVERQLTLEELQRCLKRLVKSVNNWNNVNGRQGYLNYIQSFFAPQE